MDDILQVDHCAYNDVMLGKYMATNRFGQAMQYIRTGSIKKTLSQVRHEYALSQYALQARDFFEYFVVSLWKNQISPFQLSD